MGLGGLSYKNESHLKKKIKKIKPNGRIPYDPTILCDPTRFYIRSYHFCNLATILNFLVRWDRKVVRFTIQIEILTTMPVTRPVFVAGQPDLNLNHLKKKFWVKNNNKIKTILV